MADMAGMSGNTDDNGTAQASAWDHPQANGWQEYSDLAAHVPVAIGFPASTNNTGCRNTAVMACYVHLVSCNPVWSSRSRLSISGFCCTGSGMG